MPIVFAQLIYDEGLKVETFALSVSSAVTPALYG